jgi:hypothetical protein
VKVTNTTNIKKRAITTHLKSLNTKKTSTYMYDVRCFLMMTWQITVLYMFSYDDLTNHSVIHVFLWWPDKSQCYTCFYLMMTWQITVLYMFSYDDLTNHSVIHVFITLNIFLSVTMYVFTKEWSYTIYQRKDTSQNFTASLLYNFQRLSSCLNMVEAILNQPLQH